ncbi:MAG TPA: hypothetical protein VJQ82_04480 [Terriglobales bacterium]|nr:hypothetical protein [Terriglobales bacterium]
MAGTIFRIADVLSVARSTASTYRPAIVPYAVFTGKREDEIVGARGNRLETRKRLAISLKLAIKALESNIHKLEKTAGSPLLIVTRKKRLARMQEELANLYDRGH